MKKLLEFLIVFKIIKIIIGSVLAIYVIKILINYGFIDFIMKTLNNL